MKALRLRPPEIAWTPELRWVLARAFGPPERPFPERFEPAAAARLAAALGLDARIGARAPDDALFAEAPGEASRIRGAARASAVQNLLRIEALREVAAISAPAGIGLVLLKGLALDALGIVPGGARPTSDLDLLVPARRIPELNHLLVTEGWSVSEALELEQHVHPLVHPRHGMLELHGVVLGVRLPGSRRSLDYDAIVAGGLTQPLPGLPESVRAPSRAVLLAHTLIHGLVQHGSAPESYPLFRVLADVADLDPAPGLLAEAGSYLRELDAEDLATVLSLVHLLGSGLPSTLYADAYSVEGRPDPRPLDPRPLLRHLVAGATDRVYAAGLRSEARFLFPLTDMSLARAAFASAWRALFLSRKQVDEIYGPPRGRLGYLGRRLFRPFDLAARWARYARARRKQ